MTAPSPAPLQTRRDWLRGAAGLAGLLPMARTLDAANAPTAWNLSDRWVFASHLFEQSPFFEIGPHYRDLAPEPRRMDLWIDYNGDKTSKHFDEIRARGIPAALEYCRTHGIVPAVATCYGSKGYLGYAEEIHQLGATICIQSSGKRTQGTMAEMMKKELEGLKPALEKAESNGCRIAVENHSGGFLLNDLDSFKAFMDLCDHPLLGLAFAPFHTQGRKETPEQYLEACLPKVFYYYAWQQNPAGKTTPEKASGEAQMPGVGPYDFGPMIKMLKDKNTPALVSPFMHRPTTARRSAELVESAMAYLEKL
jgi:sugar phosphate isomerase/epimerase